MSPTQSNAIGWVGIVIEAGFAWDAEVVHEAKVGKVDDDHVVLRCLVVVVSS
jgi:hypothetical protein